MDDDGQLAGFGELLTDVGPDSGDEGMAGGIGMKLQFGTEPNMMERTCGQVVCFAW